MQLAAEVVVMLLFSSGSLLRGIAWGSRALRPREHLAAIGKCDITAIGAHRAVFGLIAIDQDFGADRNGRLCPSPFAVAGPTRVNRSVSRTHWLFGLSPFSSTMLRDSVVRAIARCLPSRENAKSTILRLSAK